MKNDKLTTLERRRKLQELEAKGITSTAELARQLGVTDRCIRKDIEALNLEWMKTEAAADFRDQMKRRLIARSERRYAKADAEYERSRADKERDTTKIKTAGETRLGKDGKPVVISDEQSQLKEGRLGDPAYLREMRAEDRHQADICGIIVTKTALTNIDGTEEVPLVFSESDKQDLIAAIAAELGVKGDAAGGNGATQQS